MDVSLTGGGIRSLKGTPVSPRFRRDTLGYPECVSETSLTEGNIRDTPRSPHLGDPLTVEWKTPEGDKSQGRMRDRTPSTSLISVLFPQSPFLPL